MFSHLKRSVALCLALGLGPVAHAAPYAAMVMDARNGKVLHSRNADTQLHPASLTKMMTLYVAFEAVERGEISLDTYVTVSRNAAGEHPTRLGLRGGQKIRLRFLIRAAAIKSANDAATAIAEAISGSERAFARRMTRTAKAMGMKNTRFLNAHGLTQVGHYSTARDMTILGRHVIYDYPDYYNLFSRAKANAGVQSVRNTNQRLLNTYRGADGIKTGYTRAAGYNLVASAERGKERVIATVFGGKSLRTRNAQVVKLLNMGFERAPTRVALRRPNRPAYAPVQRRTVRTVAAVKWSLRPVARPAAQGLQPELLIAAVSDAGKSVAQSRTTLRTTTNGPSAGALRPKTRPWPAAPVLSASITVAQSPAVDQTVPVPPPPTPPPKGSNPL